MSSYGSEVSNSSSDLAQKKANRISKPPSLANINLHPHGPSLLDPPSPRAIDAPQSPFPTATSDATIVQPSSSGPQSLITQVQNPDEDASYPTHLITQVTQTDSSQPKPTPAMRPVVSDSGSKAPQFQTERPQSAWASFLMACGCIPSRSKTADSASHELVATKKAYGPSDPAATAGPVATSPKIIKTSPSASSPRPGASDKKWLLGPLPKEDTGKKCLVLDLDETLVHSSFKPVANADFIIPVEIDGTVHNVYVLKRPGVDVFLQRLGRQFEVVVFTASLSKYADPVLDMLDKHKVVKWRLFREACLHHKGNYVKDLSMLGRDLKNIIILDNSPASYIFHPTNAIPISSWFNDPHDTELLDLIPFLEDLKLVENVMTVLANDGSD